MPTVDIIKVTFLLLSLCVLFSLVASKFDSWSRLSLSLHVVKLKGLHSVFTVNSDSHCLWVTTVGSMKDETSETHLRDEHAF